MATSNCKYKQFDSTNSRELCCYYKDKVKENVPVYICTDYSCPILHPDLLKGLTMLNK